MDTFQRASGALNPAQTPPMGTFDQGTAPTHQGARVLWGEG